MHTTNEMLDLMAKKAGGVSNYRLAKMLNCASSSTVQNWRDGRSTLSNFYAIKVAEYLGWDPAYGIACVEHERLVKSSLEQTGEIAITWERIAERFRPTLPVLLVALLTLAGVGSARAGGIRTLAQSPPISVTCIGHFIHYAN